jgi:hypothetical protein
MTDLLATAVLAALPGLAAARAELSGVKLQGPLRLSPQDLGELQAGAWSLGPLADANGEIRSKITDAQLFFDADVTVPIRQGQIAFDDANVAHVGPDSRMGVDTSGVYVDAASGRSYVYRFPAVPIEGVEYERRGVLQLPWFSGRGKLQLQPFLEGLLRRGRVDPGLGFTEQARQLLARTALEAEIRLGDGKFAVPGLQGELVGRAEGRNTVRLHSAAMDRGLDVELPLLAVRNVVLSAQGLQLACDEIAAVLAIRFDVEGAQVSYKLEIASVKVSGLRVLSPAG